MSGEPSVPTPTPFSVLTVCTGNMCRSPAVELLLVAELGDDSGVRVASAGVGAIVGAPIPPQMATLMRAAGVSTEKFRARQLTEQMVRGADLVLALTRSHRSRIVELCPGAVRRTFTLREFARLAGEVDPAELPVAPTAERLAALVPLAAAQRGMNLVAPEEDEVVDPFGGDDGLYRRAFDELQPAVTEIARVVLGFAPQG